MRRGGDGLDRRAPRDCALAAPVSAQCMASRGVTLRRVRPCAGLTRRNGLSPYSGCDGSSRIAGFSWHHPSTLGERCQCAGLPISAFPNTLSRVYHGDWRTGSGGSDVRGVSKSLLATQPHLCCYDAPFREGLMLAETPPSRQHFWLPKGNGGAEDGAPTLDNADSEAWCAAHHGVGSK